MAEAEAEAAAGQTARTTAPEGWYQNPQWPGERHWDGARWTDEYRQPRWMQVKLKGPHAWGAKPILNPAVCCACGSPAGVGTLEKRNTDAGHVIATYTFPLCDRCAAIHTQGSPGLLAKREEKDAWKGRKEQWQRVDDAVKYKFDSRGDKATFSFRNRIFYQQFLELNTKPPPEPVVEGEELLLRTIDAHRGRVVGNAIDTCAFSPDGAWIVSGANGDQKVKLWDAESGDELHTLKTGLAESVRDCAFSPDGASIVSNGSGKITVWDAQSGAELHTLKTRASGIALSPDGGWIVSGVDAEKLHFWDPRSGEELRTLEGIDRPGAVCGVSPDGTWILLICNKDLTLVDAQTGAELRTLSGHDKLVEGAAISPDGTRIASGGKDYTLKIWDVETGACLQTLEGHRETITSCPVSPNGNWVASASNDGTVKLWDIESGACMQTLEGHKTRVGACAISPDGARIVSGDLEGRLKIWKVPPSLAPGGA